MIRPITSPPYKSGAIAEKPCPPVLGARKSSRNPLGLTQLPLAGFEVSFALLPVRASPARAAQPRRLRARNRGPLD